MSQSLAAPPPVEVNAGFAATGLSAIVRERTKLVHRAAERAGFIADLLHGRATKAGYALFLRNLHPAYVALESALATWMDHPLAGAFADPRLHRRGALASDLRAIAGPDWMDLPLLTEAKAYAEAIADASRDPGGLAGHAYARYLGDLSGGQILRPLLARTLGLGADSLGFYEFPTFVDLAAPKLTMRMALDSVPSGSELAEAFCAQAIAAFDHNIAISEAVQVALAHP